MQCDYHPTVKTTLQIEPAVTEWLCGSKQDILFAYVTTAGLGISKWTISLTMTTEISGWITQ